MQRNNLSGSDNIQIDELANCLISVTQRKSLVKKTEDKKAVEQVKTGEWTKKFFSHLVG